ncbi:DUF7511 domain-containing protein [Natrialba swarupiae]|uniref:DUF7511 domain-containing protein n=1 Tax=Natrialba swarupiae TaxID=2448032 RepID=A0A5D5AP85_9EURY|nr:hypothetical protein [Natrialba swarupiae]MCW8172130.1 hypothetical protein [Natrialba swarupiae]TYT62717.1 hypothetical protein FYC77_06705 [Natrialba swarupiae]
MSDPASGYDDRSVRERLETAAEYSRPSIDLEAIVVRYESRPDQCTVVPQECPEEKRLTTWLSADLRSFVELDEVR